MWHNNSKSNNRIQIFWKKKMQKLGCHGHVNVDVGKVAKFCGHGLNSFEVIQLCREGRPQKPVSGLNKVN